MGPAQEVCMEIRELVEKNRSYRRFHQDVAIGEQALLDLVDLARLSASAGNMQPLRYMLAYEPDMNAKVFEQLAWAAYLKDWPGPEEGERPSAYIVILRDTEVAHPMGIDHGFAAQSILLGAVEKGLGGCAIGAFNREELRRILNVPQRYEFLLVLALGKPKEKIVVETVGPDDEIRYWRDEHQVHHVPKRRLVDIILSN